MKNKLFKSITIFTFAALSAIAIDTIAGNTATINAADNTATTPTTGTVTIIPPDTIPENQNQKISYEEILTHTTTHVPSFNPQNISFDKNGEYSLRWLPYPNYFYDEITGVAYEYELAWDEAFTQIITKGKSATPDFVLKKEMLGSTGGMCYLRVKTKFTTTNSGILYSNWSETESFACWAITKENFPGIWKILKNGGQMSTLDGQKNQEYDINSDGWLDDSELVHVSSLGTGTKSYTKNGRKYFEPTYKISSLDGIEKLPSLKFISLTHYSGKKIDLSHNDIISIRVTGIRSKELTVIAPDAHTVDVEPHYDTKLKKLDLSRCDKATEIFAYGEHKTKTLKLPKAKNNLRVLSIAEVSVKTLNLNKYKNLQQVYIYNSDVSKLKINKCKDLRYLYFYFTYKIKNVDVKACKKLRGMDICSTPSLATSKVKAPAKTKITRNQGKWWYKTKAYKNDMQKLNDLNVKNMESDNDEN